MRVSSYPSAHSWLGVAVGQAAAHRLVEYTLSMGVLLPGSPVFVSLLAPTTATNSTASSALDALVLAPKQPSQANPLPALIGVVVERCARLSRVALSSSQNVDPRPLAPCAAFSKSPFSGACWF